MQKKKFLGKVQTTAFLTEKKTLNYYYYHYYISFLFYIKLHLLKI